jgi:hypothetical protein
LSRLVEFDIDIVDVFDLSGHAGWTNSATCLGPLLCRPGDDPRSADLVGFEGAELEAEFICFEVPNGLRAVSKPFLVCLKEGETDRLIDGAVAEEKELVVVLEAANGLGAVAWAAVLF